MTLSKLTKSAGKFTTKEDAVPIHSREYNILVDAINAAEETSDIALKADIASPTFTGTVTVPATGVTFTSNGTLVRSGAHACTLTTTAATNVTLPTTGTLATTSDKLSAFAATTSAELAGVLSDETGSGSVVFSVSPTLTGTVTLPDITMNGHKNAQLMIFNVFNCPLPGTDWTPSATGADLGASLATKKMWIPLTDLKVGDEIVDYYLVGDATEAAALTLDCKLTTISKGSPLTIVDVVGGGITQITAGGGFDSNATLTAIETVAVDTAYALEINGTTGAGDSIRVSHVMVTINRK